MPSPAKKIKKEPIQEGPYHCKLCAERWSYKRAYVLLKSFFARFCNILNINLKNLRNLWSFFSEGDLNNHEKTRHVKIQTYQCKICNYCSLEKSLMIRHMRTHSGKFDYNFLKIVSKILLISMFTGQRPFYCKECGYAFTTKANCERHIRKRHNKGFIIVYNI